MTDRLTVSTVFVVLMALAMATSPVAMAAGGTADATSTHTEVDAGDLDVDDVQTQEIDDVTIDSALERAARGGDTVEVFVRMDARESSLASATTETAGTTQETLRQEAEQTQAALETYTAGTPGVRILNEFWVANAALVEVDTSQTNVRDLATVDGVIHLHENFEVTADAATSQQPSVDTVTPEDRPNRENVSSDRDAEEPGDYEHTYGLEQINAPEAWESFGATGDGASVAVLDTGLDADHPEFDDFDAENNWAHFNRDGEITGDEPSDTAGHGTHVAGTIAGGNASGTAIGVAPDTELYAGAVIPGGSGSAAQILGGMQWAVEQDVDVMSMSLGVAGHSPLFIEVIENAHAEGTILVASAGNEQEGTTSSPGNDYTSVSVGASNVDLGIADFSSGGLVDTASAYGYDAPQHWPEEYIVPDVAAPGVSILSSYPVGMGTSGENNAYEHLPGTSMAAPHVSGTVALMVSENPDLTVAEIEEALIEGAEKPSDRVATEPADELGEKDTRYGHGIIDAHYSVGAVSEESESVTVSTVHEGNLTGDIGISVTGESGVPMETFTDDQGHADYQLAHGNYTAEVDEFGIDADPVEFEVDGTDDDVELTVESVLDARVIGDQPLVITSESEVYVDFEGSSVDEYTPTLAAESSVDASVVEEIVIEDGNFDELDTVELGETTTLGDFTGGIYTTVVFSDDLPDEGEVALEHTFSGQGNETTLTTGPSITFDEAPSSEMTISATLDDSITLGDSVAPEVSTTNNGVAPEEVTVVYEVGNLYLPLDDAALEPGETFEAAYSIGGVPGAVGAGDVEQAISVYDQSDVIPGFGIIGDPIVSANNTLRVQAAGNVTGTVTDADGEPIEGAEIRVADIQTRQTIDQLTTDENGEYHVDVGFRAPTQFIITAEHPAHGADDVFVPSTTDGSTLEQNFQLVSSAEYAFDVEADEPTPIGVPGATDGTVGDIVPDDTEGVIWAFDATANEWVTAAADDELEPLEAVVVVANDDTTAEVAFVGPEYDGMPSPPEAPLDDGWNFVAPAQHGHAGDVFTGSADPGNVLDAFADADSRMVHGEDLDTPAFPLPGDGVENATVNPFSGYFVYANEDGGMPAYVYDGVTQGEANDLLGIETDSIEGTVTAENTGEPIETATVGLEDTTLETFSESDGTFAIDDVATEIEQTVTADASGYAANSTTAEAGEGGVELVLTESNYVVPDDEFDAPGTVTLNEDFTVDATVENDGAETADETEVQLRIGNDVTQSESAILEDPETFVVDVTEVDVAANGSTTVTFEETVRTFHPTGEQEIAIVAEDGTSQVGTINISSADVTIEDQRYEDSTDSVQVSGANADTDYVVTVHDGTNVSDPVLGVSDARSSLEPATDLDIGLDNPLTGTQEVTVALHEAVNGSEYGDPIELDNEPVADRAEVEILSAEGASATFDDQALGTDEDGNVVVAVDDLESAELVTQDVTDPSDDVAVLYAGNAVDAANALDYAPISEADNGTLTLEPPADYVGELTVEIHAGDGSSISDEAAAGSADAVGTVSVTSEEETLHGDLANAEGSTEVVVQLSNAPDSTFTTDADRNVETLKQHAETTQSEFVRAAENIESVETRNTAWIVNSVLIEVDADDLDRVAALDHVEAIYPNQGLFEVPESAGSGAGAGAAVSPDSHDAHTYGLDLINAPDVWNEATGEGVRVSVIDTGVADHPDIDLAEFHEFNDSGAITGAEPVDPVGHGTHVAGTIAGGQASGLADEPHIGVAPDAELLGLKAFNASAGSLPTMATISAMQWSVEEGDADVVSMSFGGSPTGLHFDGQQNMREAGVVPITSSGNDGEGTTGEPAATYDSLSIGSVDANEDVAASSSGMNIHVPTTWNDGASLPNLGENDWVPDEVDVPVHWPRAFVSPDVSAPGVNVLSAEPGGGYGERTGTSMAAPHVSGAVALMLSASDGEHSVDEIENVLEETTYKPAGAPDEQDTRYGHGIVDVADATDRLTDAPSGTIEGVVTDSNGEPIPGVTVETADGVSDTTDENGAYTLHLEAGDYEITADAFGFETNVTDSRTVEDGAATTHDVTLADALAVDRYDDQPVYTEYESEFDVTVDARNLDEYTVEIANGSDVTADDLNVSFDGEPVDVGEPFDNASSVDALPNEDASVRITVEVDGDFEEGETFALTHTFVGEDDRIEQTTGPTELTEELEPATLELSDIQAPSNLVYGETLPTKVTVTNTGQEAAEKQIQYLLILEDGSELELSPAPMELEPDESTEYEVLVGGIEPYVEPGETVRTGFLTGTNLAADYPWVDDELTAPVDIVEHPPAYDHPRGAAESATAYDADVALADQAPGSTVTVSTATLLDGAANDTEFVVQLRDEDADQVLATSDNLTGQNENVSIDVGETVTDSTNVSASLHFADGSANNAGDPIERFAGDGFSVVTDDAIISTSSSASLALNDGGPSGAGTIGNTASIAG